MRPPSAPPPTGAADRHAAPPSGLPLPLTSFIGRERELADLRDTLLAEGIRLVTLIGPGGVGKTRLAIRAAEELGSAFPDGVWFVPLSPIRDPALVASTIARALDVRETENVPLQDLIVAYLRHRRALLVLDNFEQVLDAAPLVADLLASCPLLKLLVTSRATLRVSGEHAFAVPPLSLTADAVQLFVARAAAAKAGFALSPGNSASVAAICARLDGLPLAIELAAARVAALAPADLLTRLDTRLPLLNNGPRDQPPRLRSMHEAIAWSYDLLSPDDQSLFRRLAVFSSGFTLDAAEAICRGTRNGSRGQIDSTHVSRLASHVSVLDGIASLVGNSLLGTHDSVHGHTRYAMLETVREFAAARLAESGEHDTIRWRHATYFLALAEASDMAPFLPDGERLMNRVDDDYPNLRVALTWLYEQRDADRMLRLAGALGIWSPQSGRLREGKEWLNRALSLEPAAPSAARAKGLIALGLVFHVAGEEEKALSFIVEGLDAASDTYDVFRGLTGAGLTALRLNDLDSAAAYQQAALAQLPQMGQHIWSDLAASSILGHLGNIAVARGDIDAAETYFTRALDRQRALGFAPGTSHVFGSHPIAGLGDVARARGDQGNALAAYQHALRLAWGFGDARAIAYALGGVASSLAAAGAWEQAAPLFGATEALHETSGIHFDLETLDRQRALGLPEPWQRAADPFGAGQPLRDTLVQRGMTAHPPIPDPDMAARLWSEGRSTPIEAAYTAATRAQDEPPARIAGLTTREVEVLRLLAAGMTDREIGDALFVSRRTAATHVRNVLAKLEVSSRAAAAACAVRLGLA